MTQMLKAHLSLEGSPVGFSDLNAIAALKSAKVQ
ncbi:hypothetical protein SAMN05216476_4627 [Pseudomonas mediterranea]|uniref:Uncharacterized protein n=1 Tax=Pseudomonas mediterranea TaxID=183795 RepID=A0AAX2DGY2_9PSED|nr:hypothetical protein SAMN05216476_4627 [Pseudomonas mediterranea]